MTEKSTKLLQGLNTLDKLMIHQEKARRTTQQLRHALMIKAMEELTSLLDSSEHGKWNKLVELLKYAPIDDFERNLNIINQKETVDTTYVLRVERYQGEYMRITPTMHSVLKTILNAQKAPEYDSVTLVTTECGQ